MAVVALVDRLLGVCERVFHVLANACLAVMLVINVVNITTRAVFDTAIYWVFPWSVVLFVWMTFFSFFVIYRKNKDITVDFLIDRLGPGARVASRVLVNIIILTVIGVMLWLAPQTLASQVGTIHLVGLERYALSVPLFVSCALIFANYVIDMIDVFLGVEEPVGKSAHED